MPAGGQGNHLALFPYFAILNAGIFAIAWHKAWRILNVLGFVFTAGIGILWGQHSYRPELFASTEAFLILFVVMYVAIAVLFALRQAPNLKHYVDGTIVFGTPILGFGLQAGIIRHIEYGMAFSALALGLGYLVLAALLYARRRETLRLLVESFFALALIFGTLAIPLALDARWTSAAWAVEGAAVLWAGIRQHRLLARFFGLLLQLLAALAFVAHAQHGLSGAVPVLNSSGPDVGSRTPPRRWIAGAGSKRAPNHVAPSPRNARELGRTVGRGQRSRATFDPARRVPRSRVHPSFRPSACGNEVVRH